jgi:hypothetical protein
MATRNVTTDAASWPNGNVGARAISLKSLMIPGNVITKAHFTTFKNILIDAANHTHEWSDLYGVHSYENTDPDAYGAGVSVTETTSVPEFTPPTNTLATLVSSTDYNYLTNMWNLVNNHYHTTTDRQS